MGYLKMEELVVEGGLDCSVSDGDRACDLLRDAGVVVLRGALSNESVSVLKDVMIEADRIMKTLEAHPLKPLERDFETFAFCEACGRGLKRVDVAVDTKEALSAARRVVSNLFGGTGDEVREDASGVVLSLPGSRLQRWHRDGSQLYEGYEALPAHAITAFCPLVDVTDDLGPTQFLLGSHHASSEDPRYVEPSLSTLPYAAPNLKEGDVVLFDYRLIHRGGANKGKIQRPVFYKVFTRTWFNDAQNFPKEPTSSLFFLERNTLRRDVNVEEEEEEEEEEEVAVVVSSEKKKQKLIWCLEREAAYSESELAETPSGALPRVVESDATKRLLYVSDEASLSFLEFEDLRGVEAALELEKRCQFTYVDTVVFLSAQDLRDRKLLACAPAPLAPRLGPQVADDLENRRVAHVCVKAVVEVNGFGLFAAERIESHSLICEYAGLVKSGRESLVVVVSEEDKRRQRDGYAVDYAETLEGLGLLLSAKDYGNVARFVNHSESEANATLAPVTASSGLRRLLIVTTKTIEPGDQILMDYGKAYWQGKGLQPSSLKARVVDHYEEDGVAEEKHNEQIIDEHADEEKRHEEKKQKHRWGVSADLASSFVDAIKTSSKKTFTLRGLASSLLNYVDHNDDFLETEEKPQDESALSAWRENLDTW